MNVSLTKELEQLVSDKVKSGQYLSASEVVCEALRLLDERDRVRDARLQDLRKDIHRGLDSGDPVDGEVVFERLRGKNRARGT
jgi:antitoxin ParD1/3/4